MFFFQQGLGLQILLRKEKVWLIDVGHNSWWHMKCAERTEHNIKFENII